MRLFLLPLLIILFSPMTGHTESTVSCHCFQQRQYLPQQSHAADPYFLATAQNSLMAVLYRVEKRTLVRAKMSGAKNDDLWIAHELSRQSGRVLTEIQRARSRLNGWSEVVSRLGISLDQLDPWFDDLLGQPELLAASVIDHVLSADLGVAADRVALLRSNGGTNKEILLSVLLARVGEADPINIFDKVINGESWGKLLHDFGIYDSAAIEQKWKILLKR